MAPGGRHPSKYKSFAPRSLSAQLKCGPKERNFLDGGGREDLAWKARSLHHLNSRILDHAKFVDFAMRSVEDILMIAGVDGRITFANRRAAAILDSSEQALAWPGSAGTIGRGRTKFTRSPPVKYWCAWWLTAQRSSGKSVIPEARVRATSLCEWPRCCSGEDGRGTVLGIVASLSDITRQHELQQTKNDVMALVSHEMRTPLTAIQGMSELLPNSTSIRTKPRNERSAIHDEAKRLTHMISQYLDITRLESGTTVLRRSAVRIEALVERTLLMLDPLAAERGIRLTRHLDSNVTPVLADADLLSRAISNLVSNAIKYSPPKTEVVISAKNVAQWCCN